MPPVSTLGCAEGPHLETGSLQMQLVETSCAGFGWLCYALLSPSAHSCTPVLTKDAVLCPGHCVWETQSRDRRQS